MRRLKLNFILITITCMMIVQVANAQEYKHNVGVGAGFTTGMGLSYRYFPNKFGVQVSFLPVKNDDFRLISTGLTGLVKSVDTKYFDTFAFLGNHYVTTFDDYEYQIGIGYGLSFGRRVIVSAMLGMGFFDVTKTFNILPTAEAGIYFSFD